MMLMDDVEEGRTVREVSWLKTPFGREVSLLLWKMCGGREVMEL